MICFPNAKINIGLNILRKRNDGFHELETIFHPVEVCDALEIVKTHEKKFSFKSDGLLVDSKPEKNLCVRAYQLLKDEFDLPEISMYLYKAIPMGAGLGGGSSDAAHTLMMLNDMFGLNLNKEQLASFAAQLGSDCPFFIYNKPALATGRGEIMKPVDINLSDYSIKLVKPDIHVNTKEAYSLVKPKEENDSLELLIREPVSKWRSLIKNDFEYPLGKRYPEILEIKEELYQRGALYASMTGSGSAVYGIFEKRDKSQTGISFFKHDDY